LIGKAGAKSRLVSTSQKIILQQSLPSEVRIDLCDNAKIGISWKGSPDEELVRLQDFLSFLDSRDVLKGFNLTKELIYKLFASFDVHRKGYLTLSDWMRLFGKCYSSSLNTGIDKELDL
jgi:Ca2+-binding EF-hand superfamily protein